MLASLNRRKAVINNTDAIEDYVTIIAEVHIDNNTVDCVFGPFKNHLPFLCHKPLNKTLDN